MRARQQLVAKCALTLAHLAYRDRNVIQIELRVGVLQTVADAITARASRDAIGMSGVPFVEELYSLQALVRVLLNILISAPEDTIRVLVCERCGEALLLCLSPALRAGVGAEQVARARR